MDELKNKITEIIHKYMEDSFNLGSHYKEWGIDVPYLEAGSCVDQIISLFQDRFPDTGKRIICDICGCQISPYEHLCIGTKSTLNDYFRQYGRTVHKGGRRG